MQSATDITLPVEPFISVGGLIIVAFVTGGFGLLSIWLSAKFKRVESQTAPTGNGYADRTEAALTTIAEAVQRVERQGESTNRRLDTLTDRFNDHLEKGMQTR